MNPENMGTTGLQAWVNDSWDLWQFKARRNEAEQIIVERLGGYAALIFVERLCDDRLAARRQRTWNENSWEQHTRRALEWSREIKAALIRGEPCPIKVEPAFQHTLELGFDIATGQCPFVINFPSALTPAGVTKKKPPGGDQTTGQQVKP